MLLSQSVNWQTLFYVLQYANVQMATVLDLQRITCSTAAVLIVGGCMLANDYGSHMQVRKCNGPAALTTEYIFILCLEILPDNKPHVGHGERREMGGRSSGKLSVCVII